MPKAFWMEDGFPRMAETGVPQRSSDKAKKLSAFPEPCVCCLLSLTTTTTNTSKNAFGRNKSACLSFNIPYIFIYVPVTIGENHQGR